MAAVGTSDPAALLGPTAGSGFSAPSCSLPVYVGAWTGRELFSWALLRVSENQENTKS